MNLFLQTLKDIATWIFRKYRNRRRLYVYASRALTESFDGIRTSTRHFLSIYIENKSPNPIDILSWAMDIRNPKPLVLEMTDLPATLKGYRSMTIQDHFDIKRFEGLDITGLYVVTGGDKKWYITKDNVRDLRRDLGCSPSAS